MIVLFIKDFILNLSRSQLFLQSSLIEEHPIQQAFIVLMFPSLLFGQQKAAIKSLNGWLALLCSRSLCLGCDVMHTWWANIQKLLNTYSAIGMEHYGVTVFIKVFFTVHFYTLGIFFQQDCSTKTAWAGDGSSSRYQSRDLCCTILSEDEQDLQNLFSCLLHAHKQTKMPPEGKASLLNFAQFSSLQWDRGY